MFQFGLVVGFFCLVLVGVFGGFGGVCLVGCFFV